MDSARLPTPDEVQSVQRPLQDAGAVQTAEKSGRQGAGRLQSDPAIVPGQHDAAVTQGFERQYQLVVGQETHLPERRSPSTVGSAESRNASQRCRGHPVDMARMALSSSMAHSQTSARAANGPEYKQLFFVCQQYGQFAEPSQQQRPCRSQSRLVCPAPPDQ